MADVTPALPTELQTWVYQHRMSVAAAASSLVSTVAGFPLDSIKARLQVRRYPSIADAIRQTYAEEGIRAFFRGMVMPLLTITIVRTTSISIYSNTKERLQQYYAPSNLLCVASQGFAGGATSGIMISVGSSAFELIKIRSQLDYLISRRDNAVYKPVGTLRGAAQLYQQAGVRGFYFGFPWHCARDTLGTGIYFAMYDSFRYWTRNNLPAAESAAPFVSGSLAGVMSWFLVYVRCLPSEVRSAVKSALQPVDLVKTRVQRDALAGLPRTPGWTIFTTLASRGIKRLYRGLGISVFRSMLTHGLTWSILERISSMIAERHEAAFPSVAR